MENSSDGRKQSFWLACFLSPLDALIFLSPWNYLSCAEPICCESQAENDYFTAGEDFLS